MSANILIGEIRRRHGPPVLSFAGTSAARMKAIAGLVCDELHARDGELYCYVVKPGELVTADSHPGDTVRRLVDEYDGLTECGETGQP